MQKKLVDQAIIQWEEEVIALHIDTPRWADELDPDVVFDVLEQNGLLALPDAPETEEAETLRTALFSLSALRFPGDW